MEEWIKIEINRNTIGNQIDEIQAVSASLQGPQVVNRLEQLETRKLNDGLVSELAEIRRLLEEINKEVESNQTNPLDSSDGEANIGETPTD
ncbi:MAG: hypothetical protein R3C11_01475 [Planctomycetaceae bacterium]